MITGFIDNIDYIRHNLHTYHIQISILAGWILIPRMIIRTPIPIIIIKISPPPIPQHSPILWRNVPIPVKLKKTKMLLPHTCTYIHTNIILHATHFRITSPPPKKKNHITVHKIKHKKIFWYKFFKHVLYFAESAAALNKFKNFLL